MGQQLWTPEMDALLLDRHGKGLKWKAIAPINGMNETRCQTRLAFLQSNGGVSAAVTVKRDKETDVQVRDGIDWLLKKNRLSARRHAAAQFYRKAFRDGGDVSLKSCLDVGTGGGMPGPGIHADAGSIAYTQALRDLHTIRTQVLWSQDDLVTAVDAICGVGQTPRDLSGGDGWRARTLEAVLMVALDLIARWLDTRARAHG